MAQPSNHKMTPKVKNINQVTPGNKIQFLSVVFSFRNEEENIDELIQRTSQSIKQTKLDYEIIFVNDQSTDGSLEKLESWNKKDARIKVINFSRNFGLHEGHIAGFEHAKGDAIIYLDADLQDPPELIPALVSEWKAKKVDIVRTVRTQRLGEGKFRLFMFKWGYRVINWGAYFKITENSGDYRLISRKVADAVLLCREKDPFIRTLTLWHGFPSVEIYYCREKRNAGASGFGFQNPNVWIFFLYMYTSFSIFPILLMIGLGITLSILFSFGFIVGLFLLIFQGTTDVITWFSFAFSWSTIIASLGMVGFYVHRVHRQVIDRPMYHVSSTLGFD